MTIETDYPSQYGASRSSSPSVMVDSMLSTLHQQAPCVLLVERANQPQRGRWGLPGSFIDIENDGSTCATTLRKLTEKTNVPPLWLEQLDTFSGPDRDPRGWSLTVTWPTLVARVDCTPHIVSASNARRMPVDESKSYSFALDHKKIITMALRRLWQKTMYSLLSVYCLPEIFTHRQLLEAIEVILDQSTQRKSLIHRSRVSEMFEDIGENVATGTCKTRLWRCKPNVDSYPLPYNLLTDQ